MHFTVFRKNARVEILVGEPSVRMILPCGKVVSRRRIPNGSYATVLQHWRDPDDVNGDVKTVKVKTDAGAIMWSTPSNLRELD